MSKYSVTIGGELHDFKYKKMSREGHYAFYIGRKIIGQMFRDVRSWTVISQNPPRPSFFPIHGFKSRMACAEFLIHYHRIGDFYLHDDIMRKEQEELFQKHLNKRQ